MKDDRRILEIGCGDNKQFEGSRGLDIDPLKCIDVVSDAQKLPFEDNYLGMVYSSHAIEHFSHREVKDVLEEWTRVLKIGGNFELICPDLSLRTLIYALNPKKRIS